MKAIRKTIFWLHLCLGVVGGIVIFVMCVTGAALSFEKNIIASVEYDQRHVAVGERRLPPSVLLANVLSTKPGARPSSVAATSDPTEVVTVGFGRDGQVFVDPYTGSITGEGNKGVRVFFGFMTDLHRWLALSGDGRGWGRAITGACNLMFLGLAITGIYIWFPRRMTWKHLRPVTWFRGGINGKAREFNWHNTIGFWTSLVLIVLTVTAAVISYQWAGNLLYTLTGNEVPQRNEQPRPAAPPEQQPFVVPENIDALWAAAEGQVAGWKMISTRLPFGKDAAFTIDEGTSTNPFGRASLTLDPATAAVMKWEPYAEKNSAVQVRSWFRFTHTGESFGVIGQLIGFVACIGGAFLVYTGFALALRRLAASLRSRSRATAGSMSKDGGSRRPQPQAP
ncbi:MAG: PepSY-associated TM helix domain-containing protein [Pyrinomonadaceae bacterium]